MLNIKLKVGDKVKFNYNNQIREAFFLFADLDGNVQLSENNSVQTMGYAQNWVVKWKDIIGRADS